MKRMLARTRSTRSATVPMLAVLSILLAVVPAAAGVIGVTSHAELRSLAGGGTEQNSVDVTRDLGTDLARYQDDLQVSSLPGPSVERHRKARARSTQTTSIGASKDSISITSQGRTDIAAETNFDEVFVGAGGASSFSMSFSLDTRASFAFSAHATVATNGKDESSDAGITFSCDCDENAGPDCQAFDLDIEAEDSPHLPASASGNRSGTIGPGSCRIGAFTSSSLGSVNQASQTSFSVMLAVSASPEAGVCEGPVSRWVGGRGGAFDDPQNWDPPEVPSFGSADGQCEEALFDAGATIDVDLAAAAAVAAPVAALVPRAGGSRTAGRLHVKKVRDLRLNGGTLVLDDQALNRQSLVVDGKGFLRLHDTLLRARHAQIGGDDTGTVFVETPSSAFVTLDVLTIGGAREGQLLIRGGSLAESEEVRIGNGSGFGDATVSGHGSLWTTTKLAVGFEGEGRLFVEDGAAVESNEAFVDVNLPNRPVPALGRDNPCVRIGAAGVEVRGTSSAWRVHTLSIGGLGCVDVTDEAGIVTTAGAGTAGDVFVGTKESGEGLLLVNNAGVLVVAGRLVVGESGRGKLVVKENLEKDPRISVAGAMLIGDSLPPEGHGQVVVEGDPATNGASLTSNSLRVPDGDTATGKLTIMPGGRVTTTTTAEIGTDGTADSSIDAGQGIVEVLGATGFGPSSDQMTRWQIGESLTIGSPNAVVTGQLKIRDATVAVGNGPALGAVTIRPGGEVTGTGQSNNLLTNGGTIRNDGIMQGPLFIEAFYLPNSTGFIHQVFTAPPASPPAPLMRSAAHDAVTSADVRAASTSPLAQGPIVIAGDADLSGTKLVLQFLNGFAPHQGDMLPIVEIQGQLTGTFANVEVLGLAPGAVFDLATTPGMAVSLVDAVALPVVSIKAPKNLKETKKSGVKVTFKRTGATTAPLSVHYAVDGSAEHGIDFVTLPGVLEIPAKKKAASLVIRPLADGIVEPTETIELEVLPGDDYAPAVPSKVTIPLLSVDKKKKSK